MKKYLCALLALLLMRVSAQALSFTDARGRNVELDAPERVVALYNSYGDAWQHAGGKLVGSIADAFTGETLEAGIENLGSHVSPNMELLFALDADFVLLSDDVASHGEIAAQLEAAGIPCAFFSTPDYKSYMDMMKIFTEITGREDLYERQVERVQKPIEALIEQARALQDHPTALLIRVNSGTVKCKNSSSCVAGNILRDMGYINLADGDNALCESIGMESVLLADPDAIFVILQGTNMEAAKNNLSAVLTGNPAWSTLSAVREGRYYLLDRDLFHYHPNENWAQAYEWILSIREGEQDASK